MLKDIVERTDAELEKILRDAAQIKLPEDADAMQCAQCALRGFAHYGLAAFWLVAFCAPAHAIEFAVESCARQDPDRVKKQE